MDLSPLCSSEEIVNQPDSTDTTQQSANDKEYDFFMSYSSNDLELVRPIVNLMEKEPYQLKCCVHDKHFLYGQSTIQNIEWGLTSCKAVALFLTPDFLESNYCQHELDIALTLALENKGRIFPVVLKPCELPATLSRIHYLEESDPSVIAKKLADWLQTGFTGRPSVEGRLAGSRKMTGNEGLLSWTDIGDGYRDIILNDENMITLNALGINISDDLKLQLHRLGIIAGKQDSSYHTLAFSLAIYLAVTAVGFQLCFLPALLFDKYRSDFSSGVVLTFFWIALVLLLPTIFLTSIVLICVEWKAKISKIVAINKRTVIEHKALFYFHNMSKRFSWSLKNVMVIKCDFEECKAYLKQKNYNDTEFETWWNQLMQSPTADGYRTGLVNKLLPKVFHTRHLVLHNVVCFCQWYEQKATDQISQDIRHALVDIHEEPQGPVSSNATIDEEASLLHHEEVPV